ncbi:MAG TPA: DnaJ domain-containing protein, partial [Pyrinomonadaceae bacterium]|nr:DnaJ domain-containing protein [Pyrinomonadaceae bacterium]
VNLLIKEGKLELQKAAEFASVTNDIELSQQLVRSGLLSSDDLRKAFANQAETVFSESLLWKDGQWQFDHKSRAREDFNFQPEINRYLIDFARDTVAEKLFEKFPLVDERFSLKNKDILSNNLNLNVAESFIVSLLEFQPASFGEIRQMSAVPDIEILRSVYGLWLIGAVERSGHITTLPMDKLSDLKTAKLQKVRSAAEILKVKAIKEEKPLQNEKTEPKAQRKAQVAPLLTLEEFLDKMSSDLDAYSKLGVSKNDNDDTIKNAYYSLAKQFHPDRFHREEKETIRKIQSAFTELARTYELVKTAKSRETYNIKLSREMEARKLAQSVGATSNPNEHKHEEALSSFQEGLQLLNDGDPFGAIPALSRAVLLSPQNALFQAYYGKALSYDEKQKFKAESSMLAAIKIEPLNFKIRQIYVDFLVENKLLRRAEGELIRFLELSPENSDAKKLLSKIQRLMQSQNT